MTSRTLQDVCELIVDSEHKTAPKDPTGMHPLIRTTDLGRAEGNFSSAQRVNSETHALWTRRAVPAEGDLILAREAPVGGIARVPMGIEPVLGQRTVLLRPKFQHVDGKFLMYRLAGDDLQARMTGLSSGATVPHLNMSDIRSFQLPELPSLERQRRIASALSAFDELIEINKQRIDLLEEMARIHFNHTFPATFDPSLAKDTVASDLIAVNPKVEKRDGPYPRVTMADISTEHSHVLPSSVTTRYSGSKFQRGDVLMARITPSLENGKTALALFPSPEEVGVGSTEFIVLRGKRVGPAFVYCAARDPYFRGHAVRSMSGASGRQRVAPECFDTLTMTEPPAQLAIEFELVAMPMLELVFQLRRKNDVLLTARNRLLPRLVTGQIDISDLDLGILTPTESE